MQAKPPHKEVAVPGEDGFMRARREARQRLGMEFEEPSTARVDRLGRPLADPFPGRPVELYLRADVEAWIASKVSGARLISRTHVSKSEVVNAALRRIMALEQEAQVA